MSPNPPRFLSGDNMTIEELKALISLEWDVPEPYNDDRWYSDSEIQYLNANAALWKARNEILGLVEACRVDYGHCEPWNMMKAMDAFKAKLESL